MLLFTLPGTLTMYYGEEIGMINVPIAPEEVQDPAEKNEPGIGAGRDPERTPMQWDATLLAGFTTRRPWLPIAPEHEAVNVEAEDRDDRSLLNLYRALIATRRNHPVLVDGGMQRIDARTRTFCATNESGTVNGFIFCSTSDTALARLRSRAERF